MECFNALGVLISGGILMVALVSLVIAAILFYARFFGGELKNIKELLSNHVTDTNKRLSKLETEFKELKKEVRDKFKKILDRLPKS